MSIETKLQKFFDSFGGDVVEERVIEYVTDEIKGGRRLAEILEDPYVRNRLTDERRQNLLENIEVVDAVEEEIRSTFDRLGGSSPA